MKFHAPIALAICALRNRPAARDTSQLDDHSDQQQPGSYPITASGAASPNYAITFVPGTLTVTADNRPIPLPTLRASTNGFELAWPTNDGWTLMESTDMKTWTPVNEQLVEQDGDTTTMQSPIQGQSRRYFRFQKK